MSGLTLGKGIASAAVTLGTLGTIWHMIGGRRAFRNPWVFGPLVCGVLGGLGLAGLATGVRGRDPDLSDYLAILAFGVFLGGCGWAWAAGMRRLEAVTELLGDALPDDPQGSLDDVDVDGMATIMGDEKLEALSRLIASTGGAPGYDWLTPDWVQTRRQYLRNRTAAAPKLPRIGGA